MSLSEDVGSVASGGRRSETEQRAHSVKGGGLNEHSTDSLVHPAGSSCPNGSTNVPGVQKGESVDDREG